MGSKSVSNMPAANETVMVMSMVNQNKPNVEALDWALRTIVRPGDSVVFFGLICQMAMGKKNLCFPFLSGIGIRERLGISGLEQVNTKGFEEELEIIKVQFQNILQPFYQQCEKNEVKLEFKLFAGFCPVKLAVDEAKNTGTHWIVLDSQFEKYKFRIWAHVGCRVAIVNRNYSTLMSSRAIQHDSSHYIFRGNEGESSGADPYREQLSEGPDAFEEVETLEFLPPPLSPCWYPLSWRCGFPRAFTQTEIGEITNGFSAMNAIKRRNCWKVYQGILQETPVLVACYLNDDERFWFMLKIFSRVRHRNIMNLVGYCCTGAPMSLVYDFPCLGTLEKNLHCDELAQKLSWDARWNIALEIGGSLRYLHEECVDGPIAHLSVCSARVVLSHGSTMLANFTSAKCLKDHLPSGHYSPSEWKYSEDEIISTDVHDYGVLLMEIITGKSACCVQDQCESQSLVDWAQPYLENGLVKQIMDPRLNDCNEKVVHHMADAALHCLKTSPGHSISMSKVLAIVRGDTV